MLHCTLKLCRRLLCGLAGCCLAASPAILAADASEQKTPAKPAAAAAPSEAEAMAEMMKLATPGPDHELLRKLTGSWKTTTKMWMGPGEPQTTEGTAEYSMILGGRFLKQELKGAFMDQPFEEFGLTGYDNRRGKFIMVWGDVLATGLLEEDGTWDPATKELTFKGVYTLAGPPTPYRAVTKLVDDDTHQFTWYDTRDGKETKAMEITYTRR